LYAIYNQAIYNQGPSIFVTTFLTYKKYIYINYELK
jgi:hypothetical protein